MENIMLKFSKEEKEILDCCISITKLRTTPLLRTVMTSIFDELLDDIEKKNYLSIPVTKERTKENYYQIPIPIDEETQKKYEKIKNYIPVYASNFTKMLIMVKLENIIEKKSIEEIFT